MKAILVVDKGERCEDCRLYTNELCTGYFVIDNPEEIFDCPLKPLPKREDVEYYKEHFYDDDLGKSITKGALKYCRAKVRNEVIDEILGDTE